jgi:peptidyl-tRNA hydrolase, PTH1 family
MGAEPAAPLLAVGLGNPGAAYRRTRHNVGFMVIDQLSERLRIEMRPGRGEYWYGRGTVEARQLVLLKPVTFMNMSGVAVADALATFACGIDGLLVILDDFALPLGKLRIRTRGSDGGHNGLASVIYHLQTDVFGRLRCGIGQPDVPTGVDPAAFVLSPFKAEDEPIVRDMVGRAADAVERICRSGIDTGMNSYNTQ